MNKLTENLQSSVLVLSCFHEKYLSLVIHTITVDMFESSIYRDIFSICTSYYKKFKKPVGEHIADELQHILEGTDKEKSKLYEDVLRDLFSCQDSINPDYVITKLEHFIKTQKLKQTVVQLHKQVTEDDITGAELTLSKYNKSNLMLFDPGICFNNIDSILSFLDRSSDRIPTGIPELDRIDATPAKKELFCLAAYPNFGKSQGLIHLGKTALLVGKKVVHLTCEMPKEDVSARYVMSMFGVTKRSSNCRIAAFDKDNLGRLQGVHIEQADGFLALTDSAIRRKLRAKIKRFKSLPLIIQEFPQNQLTIDQLRVYIEGLIEFHRFVPDMLILDYADIMKIDRKNQRIDIGRNFMDVRALGKEYDIAVVTASQVSKESKKNKVQWLDDTTLAEDYTKMNTSDVLITLNRTYAEYQRCLARLFVVKARNDVVGSKVIITQNYHAAQFCNDSAEMVDSYWNMVGTG